LIDLRSLPPLFWPIGLLQDQLFGKVNVTGRPLAAVATLNQMYYSLNQDIQSRNEIVADLLARRPLPQVEIISIYLGLPHKQGHRDERFTNLIDSTYTHTDSCIYFSELLCKDLHKHRIGLRKKYRNRFFRRLPDVDAPDFSAPRAKGLMPDPSNFDSWEKWVVKKPAPKKQDALVEWIRKQWDRAVARWRS
jgi:hypothetical protein